MMQGGGPESKRAWKWMIEMAGHGDLVVLTAGSRTQAEKGPQEEALDGLACALGTCGAGTKDGFNSVQMFRLPSHKHPAAWWTAEEKEAYAAALAAVGHAEAIYFSGGDQHNYVAWPRPIIDAVRAVYRERHGVLAGSSAGMAIQGSPAFDFAAANDAGVDSIDTDFAAVSPGVDAKEISFTTDFLGADVMKGVVTDTHFHQRDRFGRLVAFLTRLGTAKAPHALGCDQDVAVVITKGVATLTRDVEKGGCFFLTSKKLGKNANGSVKSEVEVVRLDENGQAFDLGAWKSKPGTPAVAAPYRVTVDGAHAGSAPNEDDGVVQASSGLLRSALYTPKNPYLPKAP
jgi:cyanophycinase-like exopeptidase